MTEQFTLYYAGEGFYTSEFINTAFANGFSMDDLTVISQEDYDAWFNPPEGKMSAWENGIPVLVDIPEPDYILLASQERDRLVEVANAATYPISLKLQMGRKLTKEESERVNAWIDYTDALDSLDLSLAPKISWPEAPNV